MVIVTRASFECSPIDLKKLVLLLQIFLLHIIYTSIYPVGTSGQYSEIIRFFVLEAQIDLCILQLNPPK